MANCQYWYDGDWRTEEEFKEILNSGWIDKLIQDGKINIPGLEANEAQLKKFEKIGAKKAPITLRIRHKSQTRINNERNEDGSFANNNPVEVLKKASEEGGKNIPFLMVIKVGGVLQTGEGVNNAKILEDLSNSGIKIGNLKEGIPYLLVPSAYGLYPMQMKSHKIKDTKNFTALKNAINNLKNATTNEAINAARKTIEKMLYRTTVEFKNDKFEVVRFNTKANKNVPYSFATNQELVDFLGEQLFRIDYTKINKGNYNETVANNGAVSTDLYSEGGNFFNSSSFVLEAYQMSENDKEALDKIFTFDKPFSAATQTAASAVQNTIPLQGSSQNKSAESPVFNASVDNLSNIQEGKFIIRDYTDIPGMSGNYPYARVTAQVVEGKLTVVAVQSVQKSRRQNANDTFTLGPDVSSTVRSAATKKFFEDKHVIDFQEKLKAEGKINEKVADIEEAATEAASSIIGAALASFDLAATIESEVEQGFPEEEMQDLSSIIEVSNEVVPEDPTSTETETYTPGAAAWNDDDLDFDGNFDRPEPNTDTPFRLAPREDATTWNQEEELNWLKDKIGKAYTRGSGKKGTVKVFRSLEALERYLPKETYEQLLEARKSGKELHGVFTKAALFLSKNALPGTSYHEAFHIVFNLALPLSVRIDLINEAYEKFKDELPLRKVTKKDGTVIYRMPSFLQVEELLADKFMDFVTEENAKEADAGFDYRSEAMKSLTTPAGDLLDAFNGSVKLAKQFNAMRKMLKVFFFPEARINIDNIFQDINLGIYKHAVKFKSTRMPEGIRLRQETAPDLRYDNVEEERQAFEYLETLMDEILTQYRNKLDPEGRLNDKEVISKIGVHKLYSTVLSRLAGEMRDSLAKNKIDHLKRLEKLYNVLTNRGEKVEKTTIKVKDANGQLVEKRILQFSGVTDLLERFNQSLLRRGLKISYSGIKNSKETARDVETAEEDSFREYENEDQVYEESWMTSHIETNAFESVSQRLKAFFATIPKYKSNRANAAQVINGFGVVSKEDPAGVFKYLISKISNSYSMSEMMQKLQDIEKEKPYIKDIIKRLAIDPILKTELFASVGSKNYAVFKAVYEKNGTYSIIDSNRKGLDAVIKEEIIAQFLTHSNPLLKEDLETIDTEKAKQFAKNILTVYDFLVKNQSAQGGTLTAETIDRTLSDVSKLLTKNGINLSKQDLQNVVSPKEGKFEWKNLIELLNTVNKIAKELSEGNNVFAFLKPTEELITKENRKEKTLVEELARKITPVLEREVVSSFRNIDNKTVYNLILSGFLDKQMSKFTDYEKLQDYLEEIAGDPLMSNLPILQDLLDRDSNFQKNFHSILLDGLTRKGKKQAASYADMSDIEMEATSMAMFYKSADLRKAYYKLPIPSDSPTIAYIQGEKLSKEEIVDRLVKTAEAEFGRIKKLQTSKADSVLRRIPNYFNKGTKFQILNFLNGKIDTKKGFNEAKVRAEIEKFLDEDITKSNFFKKEIDSLKKKGVILAVNETTGKIAFSEKVIDKSIKDSTDFFKSYLLNTYYMNTQLTTLLGGDPAFYKNTTDYQKRFKQVLSPGMFSDTENQRDHYKAIILNDEFAPTTKETQKHILAIINKANMPESEKVALRAVWTTTDHNYTDAATFISAKRRKETMEGLGRWTPEHDAAMARMKAGKETIEDLELLNPPFKPEKPFIFSHRIVQNGDGTTTVVPTQIKNAETVLTKSFAEKKDAAGNFLYPKLAALYADMESGKIDTAIFESAVKVGGIGNSIDKDGKVRFTEYEKQPDGSYKLPENAEIIDLKTEDWRLQQETPPHYVDERGNFGTQLRNLIIGDIKLDGNYTVGGKTMKGSDVARLFQELIVEDLKTSFEDVREMFENPDGTINYEKLASELRREVIDREMGQEYLDALAPIEVVLKNGEKEIRTALPLYHPMIAYKMEAVMNSFFKNRVTKQKINGGALINTTAYGVSDQLQIVVDDKTGTVTYQALLPAWSKQFFPKNSKGEVDIEALRNNPQAADLLKIVGYRIPTEDKYSMFNIEVVGFTPISMGGTVILPVEVTTSAGLDFDIDKLYFMAKAFTVNKKGEAKTVRYYDSANTQEEALLVAENIYKNFRDYTRFIKATVKKESDQDRMIKVRRDLLEKQAEAYELKKEIAETDEFLELKEAIKQAKDDQKAALAMAQTTGEDPDPVWMKFIQDTIDGLYKELEEEYMPFNESMAEIKAVDQSAIEFIAKRLMSKDFNPIEANSKKARDNKKLDIIHGILENENTAASILNPGNFESLRESSAKIRLLQAGQVTKANKLKGKELVKAAEALDDEDFNINYPSTQLELFRRNMMGKQLIGIFANHNTHHAKAQFTNLALKSPIKVNGQEYLMLNQVYNNQGQRISKLLATDLAAVVDNAKDPIASFLNMNTFTANTIALMQRLGIEEDFIYAFVNQPVILELTQKYYNDRGSLSEEKQFSDIKNKWQGLLNAKLKEAGINADTVAAVDFTTDLLEKNLNPDKSVDYYIVQSAVLKAFGDWYETAGELGQGIQASRVDTTGVGPTSAANYTMLQKQRNVLEKIKKDTNKIQGAEEIFWGGSEQVMIPGFTKYGLISPINVLNKIFPSIGTINEKGGFSFSILGELKNKFAEFKRNKALTEKEAQMINTHFINFIASNFPFFRYDQSKDVLGSVPNRLIELKNKIPADAPYKMFLDKLYVVEANAYSTIRRIEYYNTGKRPVEIQRVKYAWERMMQDSNPEVKELALDLVKYTYFANGYGFGPYSFANMIPVKFWTNEFQIANNIVDSKGNPFNIFLEQALDSQKLADDKTIWEKRFIDQFLRNNYDKEGFVPAVKIDKTIGEKEGGTTGTQMNNVVTEAAKNSKGGIIQTPKGALIINKEKNKGLIPNNTPVPFIKVYGERNAIYLYKYVPSKFEEKNPDNFDGKRGIDTIMYQRVSTLGTSNFVLEYDYFKDIENSLLADVKATPNPKVGINPSIADQMAAEMIAEEEAMRAAIGETPSAADVTTTVAPTKVTNEESIPELGSILPTKSTTVATSEITKSNYTRQQVENDPNTAYVFTENNYSITAFPNRIGGGSAVIRGLANAFAIVTKKKYDYNTKENVDYTDTNANFQEFVNINTKLINDLKASGKSKIVFPQGFATDKAKMPERFAVWLQKELLDNFGLVTELNSTKTGLISKSTTLPIKPTVTTNKINFEENQTGGYPARTRINASADATIHFADNFETPGEKLTEKSVKEQGKVYRAIETNGVPFNAISKDSMSTAINNIVKALNTVNAKSLNIAGNGIYDMKGRTQEEVDEFTYTILNGIVNSPDLKNKITLIRSGGQTGFDEAGAKAGMKLGIPTTILAPKDWEFRTNQGNVKNEQAFKARFTTTQPAAPVAPAKPAFLASLDTSATEKMGIFEQEYWNEYKEAAVKLPEKERMPQEVFISLNYEQQIAAIEHAKNC